MQRDKSLSIIILVVVFVASTSFIYLYIRWVPVDTQQRYQSDIGFYGKVNCTESQYFIRGKIGYGVENARNTSFSDTVVELYHENGSKFQSIPVENFTWPRDFLRPTRFNATARPHYIALTSPDFYNDSLAAQQGYPGFAITRIVAELPDRPCRESLEYRSYPVNSTPGDPAYPLGNSTSEGLPGFGAMLTIVALVATSGGTGGSGSSDGSILAGVFWIFLIGLLLFWLPVLGPLLAGIVGGNKAGGVIDGILAAILPTILMSFIILTGFSAGGLPIIGALLAGSVFVVSLYYGVVTIIGAIIGGALA